METGKLVAELEFCYMTSDGDHWYSVWKNRSTGEITFVYEYTES